MNPAILLGIGALASGAASLITALAGMRRVKKQAVDDCDKRIAQWREAFREGLGMEPRGKDDEEMEERWSHLP